MQYSKVKQLPSLCLCPHEEIKLAREHPLDLRSVARDCSWDQISSVTQLAPIWLFLLKQDGHNQRACWEQPPAPAALQTMLGNYVGKCKLMWAKTVQGCMPMIKQYTQPETAPQAWCFKTYLQNVVSWTIGKQEQRLILEEPPLLKGSHIIEYFSEMYYFHVDANQIYVASLPSHPYLQSIARSYQQFPVSSLLFG